MTDLTVSVIITTPGGGQMGLNVGGYQIEAASRSNRQVAWRKTMAESPFVAGSYPVTAVKENVIEAVNVYVRGSSTADLRAKLEAVTDCLDQINYRIAWGIGDDVEYWRCFTADYSIESNQPLQIAKMALIKAQIPRRPALGTSL